MASSPALPHQKYIFVFPLSLFLSPETHVFVFNLVQYSLNWEIRLQFSVLYFTQYICLLFLHHRQVRFLNFLRSLNKPSQHLWIYIVHVTSVTPPHYRGSAVPYKPGGPSQCVYWGKERDDRDQMSLSPANGRGGQSPGSSRLHPSGQ